MIQGSLAKKVDWQNDDWMWGEGMEACTYMAHTCFTPAYHEVFRLHLCRLALMPTNPFNSPTGNTCVRMNLHMSSSVHVYSWRYACLSFSPFLLTLIFIFLLLLLLLLLHYLYQRRPPSLPGSYEDITRPVNDILNNVRSPPNSKGCCGYKNQLLDKFCASRSVVRGSTYMYMYMYNVCTCTCTLYIICTCTTFFCVQCMLGGLEAKLISLGGLGAE